MATPELAGRRGPVGRRGPERVAAERMPRTVAAVERGLARSGIADQAAPGVDSYLGEVLSRVAERLGTTVGQLLGRGAGLDRLGDVDTLVARMTAALPRTHPFDEYGPYYTVTDVSRWTGKHRQAVHQRVQRHGLLGMPTSDGTIVLPAWQFTDDGEPIPGLKTALDALAVGIDDPWTWAQWLTAPHRADDERPTWQVLAAGGGHADEVLAEARADGERWRR